MWIFGIFSLFCVLPCSSFFLSELLWTDSSETEKRGNETTDELKTLKQQNATFNGSIDLIKNADNFTEESNISREQSSTSAALTVIPPGTNTTENITENTIEYHDTADKEEEQKAEERMHIEYIKRQLMAKLRLSSAPVSKSDASVLPLAELGRGFLQTQHDQGQKKYKPHHFYAKALQIYVIGNDGKRHFLFFFLMIFIYPILWVYFASEIFYLKSWFDFTFQSRIVSKLYNICPICVTLWPQEVAFNQF